MGFIQEKYPERAVRDNQLKEALNILFCGWFIRTFVRYTKYFTYYEKTDDCACSDYGFCS